MFLKCVFLLVFSILYNISIIGGSGIDSSFVMTHINSQFDNDEFEESIKYIEQLVQTEEFTHFSCFLRGKIHHNLATAYYFLDNESKAISIYTDKTLRMWDTCAKVPPEEKANTMYNIGICYQYTSSPNLAGKYIDEALDILGSIDDYDPKILGEKYQGAGNYYADIKDELRAKSFYELALLKYGQDTDYLHDRVHIYNRLILLNIELQELSQAKSYFIEVQNVIKNDKKKIPNFDLSQIYFNGSNCLVQLDELNEARKFADLGLALLSEEESPIEYSIGLEILGAINKNQGNYVKALSFYNRSLNLRIGDKQDNLNKYLIAVAYENISETLYLQSKEHSSGYSKMPENISKADSNIQKALSFLNEKIPVDEFGLPILNRSYVLNPVDEIRMLGLKADILLSTNNDYDVVKHKRIFSKIDTIIGRSISSFNFEESQLQLYKLVRTFLGQALEHSLQFKSSADLETPYYYASKAKTLIFRDQVQIKQALRSSGNDDLINDEKDIRSQLTGLSQTLNYFPEPPDSLLSKYVNLQIKHERLLELLEVNDSEYSTARNSFLGSLSIADIQSRIDKDDIVIEFFETDNTLHAFSIHQDSVWINSFSSDDVLDHFNSFINFVNLPDNNLVKHSKDYLYTAFFKQLVPDKLDVSQITIIPDGIIHKVPFEALSDDLGRFLIESFTFQYMYSNQFIVDHSYDSKATSYMGFGTNYNDSLSIKLQETGMFSTETRLLPFNLAEAEIMESDPHKASTTFLGNQATKAHFLESHQDANILHLSLHGIVNNSNPNLSSIVFHPSEDFVLTSSTIRDLDISSDLIVLSSCSSADGKIYQGEGVLGMSRSFLQAGAKDVVSSLWSASENSAFEIMKGFMNKIQDDGTNNISQSLRKAKLNYLNDTSPKFRHPYYWANYVHIGTKHQERPNRSLIFYAALMILSIIMLYFLVKR